MYRKRRINLQQNNRKEIGTFPVNREIRNNTQRMVMVEEGDDDTTQHN